MAENEIRGLANADLVVKVDLQEFSSLDYQKADAIIQKGIEAATQKSGLLSPYSLDDPPGPPTWTAETPACKAKYPCRSL